MQFDIKLHISKTELKKYYKGVTTVTASCSEGRRVQFPVNILQKYIGHDGIHGRFCLEYDENFKFKKITQL